METSQRSASPLLTSAPFHSSLLPLSSMSASGNPLSDPAGDEPVDQFDRLPDPVLLLILNRIGDVKSLGRCSLISRRFHSLVPLVDRVDVRVDCVISDDPGSSSANQSKPRGVLSNLARAFLGPFQALSHILIPSRRSPSPSSCSSFSNSLLTDVSHHSPSEVLKNFKEIRHLQIDLPSGELGTDEGVLLKWKASFGSTLETCVILGASSVSSSESKSQNPNPNPSFKIDEEETIPEPFQANGVLKLRVVWTISALIAASARHYLLQPIISDHETLETLDLTDGDGQGVLTMDKGQLDDFRANPVSASCGTLRTQVPALSVKLWYAPWLEMESGVVLKGATLVTVRPSGGEEGTNGAHCPTGDLDSVFNAFDEPYGTAVALLVKRRNYCIEMNSF